MRGNRGGIKLYKDNLFNHDISWEQLASRTVLPERLYKYQAFYEESGTENIFWKQNMQGEFHLSLACEFEDINDCRPYFDKNEIVRYIVQFLEDIMCEKEHFSEVKNELKECITENYLEEIKKNYQKEIRIGCFTNSYKNEKMWDKYGDEKKGFCIEYDTRKGKQFSLLTLPVFYSSQKYNMSLAVAYLLILETIRKSKKRSEGENLKIYGEIYKKLIKTTYIPVFLKDSSRWSFENEFRMCILKHMATPDGTIKMEDILDKRYNIDLGNAITAIYLGADFDKNKNADKLYNDILQIKNRNKSGDLKIYRLNEKGIIEV